MHQHKCAKKEDEEEESADLWLAFKYIRTSKDLSQLGATRIFNLKVCCLWSLDSLKKSPTQTQYAVLNLEMDS